MRRLRTKLSPPAPAEPIPPAIHPPGERELALERELTAARARLEELTGSNAEYRAINEELQSANEALLASREELQSMTGEMQTINGELAQRLSELANLHHEAADLLEATRIATLFLDNGLRVKRFTPRLRELFALVEGDLGRKLGALGVRLPYAELEDDAAAVLRTRDTVRRRIHTPGGQDCIVRVLVHRTADGFVVGAVVTVVEID